GADTSTAALEGVRLFDELSMREAIARALRDRGAEGERAWRLAARVRALLAHPRAGSATATSEEWQGPPDDDHPRHAAAASWARTRRTRARRRGSCCRHGSRARPCAGVERTERPHRVTCGSCGAAAILSSPSHPAAASHPAVRRARCHRARCARAAQPIVAPCAGAAVQRARWNGRRVWQDGILFALTGRVNRSRTGITTPEPELQP